MNASYRRTNDASPLEVESSTAGASRAGDLGPIRESLDELREAIANIAWEAECLDRRLNLVYEAIDTAEMANEED